MIYNGFINILNTPIGASKKESGDMSSMSVHGGKLGLAFPLYSLPACLTAVLTLRSPVSVPGSLPWSPSLLPHSLGFFHIPFPFYLYLFHFWPRFSSPSLTPCL